MQKHYDGYINCPNCGKIIQENATYCPHCNIRFCANNSSRICDSLDSYVYKYKVFLVFLVLAMLYFITSRGFFQITHLFPHASYTVPKITKPYAAIQKNLSPPPKVQIGKGKYRRTITMQAEYSLPGIVVAKNIHFRFINRRDFDDVVPMDIGIVWGDIADVDYLNKNFKFVSETAWGARWLRTEFRTADMPDNKIHQFITHNHIIPANDNITSALLSLKKWDLVKLDGYLVDIEHPNGSRSYTSLSRNDGYHGGRTGVRPGDGAGSCEIMYVTGVQKGNRYYK